MEGKGPRLPRPLEGTAREGREVGLQGRGRESPPHGAKGWCLPLDSGPPRVGAWPWQPRAARMRRAQGAVALAATGTATREGRLRGSHPAAASTARCHAADAVV